MNYETCSLCPRECKADRRNHLGFCRSSDKMTAARAALHHWEEPCISGTNGSGTVFFSGCTLRCCYCQNYKISRGEIGKEITPKQLAHIFLNLQEQGAHNINLVTATHFLPSVLTALDMAKTSLTIPVVYNCSGYEKTDIIHSLKGYVDIFLPDLKYMDNKLAITYSQAPDYFKYASKAVLEMIHQTGAPQFDNQGILKKGVILRHLVLPSHKDDSIAILNWMASNLPKEQYLISILSQYTPFFESSKYPQINRSLTTYEYQKVIDTALALGLNTGFMQNKSSTKEEYTPPFDLEGLW